MSYKTDTPEANRRLVEHLLKRLAREWPERVDEFAAAFGPDPAAVPEDKLVEAIKWLFTVLSTRKVPVWTASCGELPAGKKQKPRKSRKVDPWTAARRLNEEMAEELRQENPDLSYLVELVQQQMRFLVKDLPPRT
jgi:hypothetical protein